MIRILADSNIPFLRGLLEPVASVSYLPDNLFTRKRLSGYDAIIIRTRTRCTESLLKDTPVRFIGTATIGTDHIDTEWCAGKEIRVANAPGCNAGAVMQYVTAALLYLDNKYGFHTEGRTLGVIGAGNVGKKVINAAEAIGMRVLVNDPPRARVEGKKGFVSLHTIASESDIVTFHAPLTLNGPDPTWHLGDKRFFELLRRDSLVINSARGGIVDEQLLMDALVRERINGAVIDTWEGEPDADRELISLCDIATPHIAGYSMEGKRNATLMMIDALAEFFNLDRSLIKTPEPLTEEKSIDIAEIITADKKYPGHSHPAEAIFTEGNINNHELLNKIVSETYNIEKDSEEFKLSPASFEQIRNNYPVRREFSAFPVNVTKGIQDLANSLELLEFKIR